MKKYILSAAAALITVFLVVYGYRIFMDKPGPEHTLAEFQDAFNRYDFERMINCLESEKAKSLRELLSLEGDHLKLTSRTLTKLAQLVVQALPRLSDNIFSEDNLPKLELTVQSVSLEDDYSSARARATLISGESQWSFDV